MFPPALFNLILLAAGCHRCALNHHHYAQNQRLPSLPFNLVTDPNLRPIYNRERLRGPGPAPSASHVWRPSLRTWESPGGRKAPPRSVVVTASVDAG
ncbi:hypothetical protein B0H11DRAFT_2220311 [Mycena galericulata]|nr:hypothetical protein B0H11DRAFT_2220311 [Mycena galericulata]